jgi:hypothetical protein
LCLDFDGVLHSYVSGWRGPVFIPDPPVPGAMAFLVAAVQHFDVQIFSSRSHEPGGIEAMQAWVAYWIDKELGWNQEQAFPNLRSATNFVANRIKFPVEKPPAFVTLDDRALTFTGEWPSMETLLAFKPWNVPHDPARPA